MFCLQIIDMSRFWMIFHMLPFNGKPSNRLELFFSFDREKKN